MSLKAYEILFIILPDYTQEKTTEITNEIQELITSNNGNILNFNDLGLKEFAMELKKQKQGYYFQCQFQISTKDLKKVQDKLILLETIFRYQIVTLESVLSKENLSKILES